MTDKTTRTLEVPGAVLTYDVRAAQAPTDEPPLLMIGFPMAAEGFTTLAGHFTDRTVVTCDPRGSERSTAEAGAAPATPYTHADDLHRLVDALGGGPVDVFASSGGAVNALAWVERHPADVRTLVAHEPPIARLLPDREAAVAVMTGIHETYRQRGWGHAMAQFIAVVSHEGPFPDGFLEGLHADPAAFGLPTEDDGSRDDPMLGGSMVTMPHYEPDVEAIGSAPTRVVPAVGEESAAVMTGRATTALAAELGLAATVFPGGHGGFLGGEYGQTGRPGPFADRLREVLAGG